MKLRHSKAGFTLVELIVVIAILAILAGVAVPVYSGYIAKANEAGDLQLLGAVNTAFASACAAHGVDPTQVFANATLAGPAGEMKLTGISAAGNGVDADALDQEFMRFYADNKDKAFRFFTSLGYDRANGVFVDGAKEFTVMYNGKPVTVTMAQIAAYQVSTFGSMGSDKVLNEVNDVVTAAAAALSSLSDPNNPDYAEYRAELESFLQENYGIGLAGLNDTQRANALVLMVASKAKNMSAADLVREYNESGSMTSLQVDPRDGASLLSGMATSTTIPYALALAYVNSEMAKDDTINAGRNIKTYYASIDEAIAAGYSESEIITMDDQQYNLLSTLVPGIKKYYVNSPETYDVKNLFYNGGTIGSGPERIEITGANNMSNANDVQKLTEYILVSDGFKAYMQSGQGEQDLNAYFNAMAMMSDNAGNIDTNDLLTYGFGDEALQTMVAAILGG